MVKTKTKKLTAFFTAMAMMLSPVSSGVSSVPVFADELDADWGWDYTADANSVVEYADTAVSFSNDYTDLSLLDYDYSYNYDDGSNSYEIESYSDYTEEEPEIGEEVDVDELLTEETSFNAGTVRKLAASRADNRTYYITGFNASVFYTKDGSIPYYEYGAYGNSTYTHTITANDVIVEPVGYCIERNGSHVVPTNGLTRRTISEAVSGDIAGVYMSQYQADSLIRVLLHKQECYNYAAQTFNNFFPGMSLSQVQPGQDAAVCRDYITQQFVWGAVDSDLRDPYGWADGVANWAYNNFTETCTGGQGYDINYYVSNNTSQQNVIGSVFKGTQNNPADPYVDSVSIRVVKVDESNKSLGGARFTVYDDVSGTHIGDSIVGTPWTTSAQETSHTVDGLSYGLNFILRENSAPQNYVKATDTYFNVDLNGNINVTQLGSNTTYANGTFVVQNIPDSQYISVVKTDEDGNSLSGAEFTLTDDTGIEVEKEDSTNGFLAKVNKNTHYTLTETVAPEGYTASSESFGFVVNDEGVVLDSTYEDVSANGITITVVNHKATGTISVLKVDDNNTNLRGAEFTLTDKDGKYVETTATDFGFNATVQVGETYVLNETKAPEHYTKTNDSIEFKVTSDGIECNNNNVAVVGSTLKVINHRTTHPVSVRKVTADGKNLSGAEFSLTDSDGKVVNVTNTEYGFDAELIENETYTLTENAAPTGYVKRTEPITFTVGTDSIECTSDGVNANAFTLEVVNAPIDYKVTIDKADSETNALISGATLQLIDNGTVIDEWTTSSHETESLEYDKEYTIHEVSAPSGYVLNANDITFSFSKDGSLNTNAKLRDGHIVVENKQTSISITKMDITNNTELAGATIQILENGKAVEEWVSDTAVHTITGLKTNTEYTLRETIAPVGYSVAADTTFVINEDGSVTTTANRTTDGVILVEDAMLTVYVTKQDIANEKELSGANLQVLNGTTVVDEWTSNGSAHLIKGIRPNTEYILRETIAPVGYTIASDITFSADVKDNKTIITTAGKVINGDTIVVEDTATEVKISKRAITGENELAGATLQVIRDGKVIEEWVSSNTAHVIKGLETGVTYTLRETSAPDGYVCTTDTTFTIGTNGRVTASATQAADDTIIINNKPTEVRISKVDITSKEEVEGAFIQILNADGSLVEDEWTSTTAPHEIEGLSVETEYILHEETAPFGYIVAEDTTFHIEKDGTVVATGSMTSDGTIVINNTKTRIAISKVDIAKNEELEGATLQVIDDNGKVVAEWVSATAPREIVGLGTGIEYTLRETIAPRGFTCAADIKFTIDKYGKVSTTGRQNADSAIVIDNRLTEISISKVDITTEEELEGARLEIIDSEGAVVEKWTSVKEAHKIIGLPTNEKFILRETVAPDGYTITTDTEFTIKTNGEVVANGSVVSDNHIMVKDSKTKVNITKVDADTDNTVEGAVLEVRDSDGKTVDKWTSTSETHTIVGLMTDKEYTIYENTAPKGYLKADTETFKVAADGTVTSSARTQDGDTILFENEQTMVEIAKVDITSQEEVAGATIQIIEKTVTPSETEGEEDTVTETVVREWVSTEQKYTVKGLETEKEYILRETVAPDGYTVASDTTFTLHEDGSITTTAPVSDDDVLLIEDTLTFVSIAKIDADTNARLSGATLQLKDEDGKVVETWVSTLEEKVFTGLRTDVEYSIVETMSPTGYKPVFTVTFHIEKDGSIAANTAITEDGIICVPNSKVFIPQPIPSYYAPVTPVVPVSTPVTVKPVPVENVSAGAGMDGDGIEL